MARGRKRKQGLREPNGRIRRERQTDVRAVALAQPHRAWLPADKRASQDAESVIGCAHLAGLITEPEYWAAIRYRRLIDAFHRIMATPMTRQSAAAIGVTASNETPAEADYLSGTPETDEEMRDRVLDAMDGIGRAMKEREIAAARQGREFSAVHGRREMDAVVLRGEAINDVGRLKEALGALVALWRLDGDAAPRRRTFYRTEKPLWLEDHHAQETNG